MRLTTILKLTLFFAFVFVGFGDRVLPEPLSQASRDTRIQVNQFMIGLFPYRKPIESPSQRTTQEIQRLDNATNSQR